nr:unnamed protein product [Callosobruchus analis]
MSGKMKCHRKKRTLWTRKWLQRTRGRALINSELKTEGPESHKNYLRLAPEQFAMLLSLVERDIKKQYTFMREIISAEHNFRRHPILCDTALKLPDDTPIHTKDLHSLKHRGRIVGLSLFYRFYHGK